MNRRRDISLGLPRGPGRSRLWNQVVAIPSISCPAQVFLGHTGPRVPLADVAASFNPACHSAVMAPFGWKKPKPRSVKTIFGKAVSGNRFFSAGNNFVARMAAPPAWQV